MAWDWDLSYLYQSFDDPAFTADLARLPELKAAMEQAVHAELASREKLEGLVEADERPERRAGSFVQFLPAHHVCGRHQ